jgi:hypothetical protein
MVIPKRNSVFEENRNTFQKFPLFGDRSVLVYDAGHTEFS